MTEFTMRVLCLDALSDTQNESCRKSSRNVSLRARRRSNVGGLLCPSRSNPPTHCPDGPRSDVKPLHIKAGIPHGGLRASLTRPHHQALLPPKLIPPPLDRSLSLGESAAQPSPTSTSQPVTPLCMSKQPCGRFGLTPKYLQRLTGGHDGISIEVALERRKEVAQSI